MKNVLRALCLVGGALAFQTCQLGQETESNQPADLQSQQGIRTSHTQEFGHEGVVGANPVFIRSLEAHPWGDPSLFPTPMALGVKENDVVLKNLVENGTGAPKQTLKNQVWVWNVISGDLHKGTCTFQNYDTKEYMLAQTEGALGLKASNSPQTDQTLYWEYEQLDNWADDCPDAPRPYLIYPKNANPSQKNQVWSIKDWKLQENTPIVTSAFDYNQKANKSRVGAQVWYLEPTRVKISNPEGKKINLRANKKFPQDELIQVWSDLFGGTELANIPHEGTWETTAKVFYISVRLRNVKGEYVNESTNGVYEIDASKNRRFKIQFFYGDPHSGGDVDIEEGSGIN